jgi:hypothetical protein
MLAFVRDRLGANACLKKNNLSEIGWKSLTKTSAIKFIEWVSTIGFQKNEKLLFQIRR